MAKSFMHCFAGNIDDGLVQPLLPNPVETARTNADVAREHDYIGVGLGQIEVREFSVQITQDVKLHRRQARRRSGDHSISQKSLCKHY